MLREIELQTTNFQFKQSRIAILTVFNLPEEVRDRMSQENVEKCIGQRLLSFSYVPERGDLFPYAHQIWRVIGKPIQLPSEYRSRSPKSPALLMLEWVSYYENIDDAITMILNNAE